MSKTISQWHLTLHDEQILPEHCTLFQWRHCCGQADRNAAEHWSLLHRVVTISIGIKGEDIFQYYSVYWNNIWILDHIDPFMTSGFFFTHSPFLSHCLPNCRFSYNSKDILHPLYFSFHFRLFNFFNDHYPFLKDLPTHDSFLCREPMWFGRFYQWENYFFIQELNWNILKYP